MKKKMKSKGQRKMGGMSELPFFKNRSHLKSGSTALLDKNMKASFFVVFTCGSLGICSATRVLAATIPTYLDDCGSGS